MKKSLVLFAELSAIFIYCGIIGFRSLLRKLAGV